MSVQKSLPQSGLWKQAVDEYVSQLNPIDAQIVRNGFSDPTKFIERVKLRSKANPQDHVSKSFERLWSGIMLVSSAVPEFTSVAWCSIEMLYNRSQDLGDVCRTLEDVFVRLARSLPRLIGYELSAPHDELNDCVLHYYQGVLNLFLEIEKYISKCSQKRYLVGGPPEPSAIHNLISILENSKSEVEAEAIAVSIKQNHQIKEKLHLFMDSVSIKPKGRLPCHMLPYPENRGFRGRADILHRMEQSLKPRPNELRTYALYGFGGVGKTQLALQFAYKRADVFNAIFWISAESSGKINQGILDAAEELGLFEPGESSVDQDKAVKTFLSWLRDSDATWLIIFDNTDDVKLLKNYWPAAKKGSILVTSRDPAILLRTPNGERVDSMSPLDAKDMFFSAVESNVIRDEENDSLAGTLLQELGYLPLAIRAAAGIIIEDDCTLADFIELCEENRHESEPFAHLDPETIGARSIQLLRIMTFFDPDIVPVELLLKGSRNHDDIRYLSEMTAYRGVSRELLKNGLCSKATIQIHGYGTGKSAKAQTDGLTTHRLILQTVFCHCSKLEKLEALAHATAMLASEFPSINDNEFRLSKFWRECHMLLPQVHAVLSRCGAAGLDLPSDFIPVLCACGRYLLERRSFDDAERMFVAAKQACKAHGLQDWEQAQFVQRSLAGIILESSVFRCDEAVNILQDVVHHYQKSRDPNDPVLGVTYSDLAQALTARGEFDQAISLCEKALSIVMKIEDEEKRRDTLFHVRHNMGRIYEMKGIPDEALRLHLYEGDPQGNGLRQEQSVYGAWNLYAVGNCLQLQKDPRAIETHAKALKIREDLLGDHYFTAMSYHKLGQLYLEA
ncbi:TPR [Fusarium mundagurra]|uniref:TPR n=1 Tax=Fusarium mundagurra TaxID=1567541 RepID=A0A8H5YHR2_9HYPO|nr:TPR [Fusarium mundagurra]